MSNLLAFTKMQGTGNDFIVLDCTEKKFDLNKGSIEKLANRHFGVGFDQLLVVEKATKTNMDFKYRIFNANGGEVEQCGNGARCFAKYVLDKNLSNKHTINVETNNGDIVLNINKDNTVTVNMGNAIFEPKSIPLSVKQQKNQYSIDNIDFFAVSVGNPHAVIIKDDIELLDIEKEAKTLQNSDIFPNSVNVGFLQIISPKQIKLRVYERGVGETLACGSGACAATIAGIHLGKLDGEVKVELLGGQVSVNYKKGEDVFLTGPAKSVFEGIINLELLHD